MFVSAGLWWRRESRGENTVNAIEGHVVSLEKGGLQSFECIKRFSALPF